MHTMTSNSPPKIQVLNFNTCSWYEMAHEANGFPFHHTVSGINDFCLRSFFYIFPFHSTKVFNEIIIIIQMMKFIIH